MSVTNHSFKPFLGSLDHNLFCLDGYADVASDGSVNSCTGLGFTIAKTATGVYTITLSDSAPSVAAIRHVEASYHSVTGTDLVPQVHIVSSSSIQIRLCAGATPTTPSAGCGLSVMIWIRRSGLTK